MAGIVLSIESRLVQYIRQSSPRAWQSSDWGGTSRVLKQKQSSVDLSTRYCARMVDRYQ